MRHDENMKAFCKTVTIAAWIAAAAVVALDTLIMFVLR